MRRDRLTWVGFAIIGAAAIAWSFTALTELAELLGVTGRIPIGVGEIRIAWGLPVSIDVFAIVATRVWLRRKSTPEALAFARWAAWAAIGSTTVGNAYHGVLTGGLRLDVVIVSAVPAVTLGALVHLAVLVGRAPGELGDDEPNVEPFAALYRHLAVAEWEAGRTVGGPGEDGAERVPSRDEPDDVLAADLRAKRATDGRRLTQDEVRMRYGVGATRAARLRELAEAPPVPPTSHPVPTGGAS